MYRDVRRGQVQLKVVDIRAKLQQVGVKTGARGRISEGQQVRGYSGLKLLDHIPA